MSENKNKLITPESVAFGASMLLGMAAVRKTQKSLRGIEPLPEEIARQLPGDNIVPNANVVLDRAFTLQGTPAEIWPWVTQIGPERGKWPLPRSIERFLPRQNRAPRGVNHSLSPLKVGDTIDDWKVDRKDPTAEVAILEDEDVLVYASRMAVKGGRTVDWSWAIKVDPNEEAGESRVQMRFRAGHIQRKELMEFLAPLDGLIIAGFAKGVSERLADRK